MYTEYMLPTNYLIGFDLTFCLISEAPRGPRRAAATAAATTAAAAPLNPETTGREARTTRSSIVPRYEDVTDSDLSASEEAFPGASPGK